MAQILQESDQTKAMGDPVDITQLEKCQLRNQRRQAEKKVGRLHLIGRLLRDPDSRSCLLSEYNSWQWQFFPFHKNVACVLFNLFRPQLLWLAIQNG